LNYNRPLAFLVDFNIPFDGSETVSGHITYTNLDYNAGTVALPVYLHYAGADLKPVLNFDGDRYVWGTNGYGTNLTATNYSGLYTFAIASQSPTDSTAQPSGYTSGQVVITTNGVATITAELADGTAVAQTVNMSRGGDLPFFVNGNLSTDKKLMRGSMTGWLTVGPKDSMPGIAGTPVWLRTGDVFDTTNYVNGFTNVSALISSAYNPTGVNVTSNFAKLGGPISIGSSTNRGYVHISGGNSDGMPIPSFQLWCKPNSTLFPIIAPRTTVQNLATITIAPATGKVTGTFNNTNALQIGAGLAGFTKAAAYNATVLQSDGFIYGGFKGTNESGLFLINGTP
jgi:hypothetical protein